MDNELSCLVCGQIGEVGIRHVSGVYACLRCTRLGQEAEMMKRGYEGELNALDETARSLLDEARRQIAGLHGQLAAANERIARLEGR